MVVSMTRWVEKVAIVTGASAGIGESIAEKLVEQGLKVVALARREDKLEALQKKLVGKKGKLYPLKTDMSKEADILKAFKWTKDNLGPVHVLVNNAGVTKSESLHEGSTETWQNAFQLNVIGLSIATREAIRDMKENNVDGQIIHINSVFGHKVINFPGQNVYPATKHAVTALTETLRLELVALKSKIRITSLSPGAVKTELSGDIAETASFPKLEAEDIADAVVYVLSTPPHVQIHELTIKPVGEFF